MATDFGWGSLLQGVGSIYGGISAYRSSKESASLLREQGSLTRDDYFRQASLTREEGSRIRAKQTMEYVSSGVELAGTPLLVLKETLSRSRAKAGAYETTGINYEKLYRKKASITENEGMSALIGSVMSAAAMVI